MKTLAPLIAAIAFVAVAPGAVLAQQASARPDIGNSTAPPPPDDSIYRAFGGKAGLRTLMEDFLRRLLADPRTRPAFQNADRENLIDKLTEQLCYESGGPCIYRGAPMKGVHRGLEIGMQDFNALVEVLQDTMDAKGIPFATQNRMLARLAPMHRDIVTR